MIHVKLLWGNIAMLKKTRAYHFLHFTVATSESVCADTAIVPVFFRQTHTGGTVLTHILVVVTISQFCGKLKHFVRMDFYRSTYTFLKEDGMNNFDEKGKMPGLIKLVEGQNSKFTLKQGCPTLFTQGPHRQYVKARQAKVWGIPPNKKQGPGNFSQTFLNTLFIQGLHCQNIKARWAQNIPVV